MSSPPRMAALVRRRSRAAWPAVWLWTWVLAGNAAGQVLAPMGAQVGPFGIAAGQSLQSTSGPRGIVNYLVNYKDTLVTLPASVQGAGYSPRSGLQLSFDLEWPGQFGYRPVIFTLRTATPAVREQRVTVRLTASDYSNAGIAAEDTVTFAQGATTASLKILVPHYQDWYELGWRVYVDGREDDHLGIDYVGGVSLGPNSTNLGVLCVGASSYQATAYQGALQGAVNGGVVTVKQLAFDELPVNWLEYTTIDVFVIPAPKLQEFLADHPLKAAALLRWLRAGGNLWLPDAGSRWEALPAVERSLGLEAGSGAAPAAGDDGAAASPRERPELRLAARGWRFPSMADRASEPTEAALTLSGFDTGENLSLPSKQPTAASGLGASIQALLGGSPSDVFVVRGYGLGAIAAFPATFGSGFNAGGNQLFTQMNQTLLARRLTWAGRHGNQPNSFNADFNKLLIPGVGVAPVGIFQVLITLFVLGIGPVNYWLLKRQHKLPLLLFTVPAAAVATTALLFAYGLLADGFGVKARARTLTLLDQRTGEAASWGRLSYYAGIAPRQGLSIPLEQAMYPLQPEWAVGYRSWGGNAMQQQQQRLVQWGETQQLSRGWLASRTPTQYLAVAAMPTEKTLEIQPTDNGLRIVNRLGTHVHHLAVEDQQGRIYWCENLPPDKGQVVPEAERDKVTVEIRRLFTENLPEAPVGADDGYRGVSYDVVASQSIMEGRLGAIGSGLVRSWGKNKYIAFTADAPTLELGVAAEQQASFHVVEGSW